MDKIDKDDNLILTPSEQRALEEAKHQGYLVYNDTHDGKYPPVAQAYFDLCRREGGPCVLVGMKGRYAAIDLYHTQWHCGFPPPLQQVIRIMGQHEAGKTWGWGDVCTQGCSLRDVAAKRAETVAHVLYWLATDPRCDSSSAN